MLFDTFFVKKFNMQKLKELFIERTLFSSALITIAVTVGIIFVLSIEAINFFGEVSIVDFLTDTEWTPLFVNKHFGILPLLSGTILITFIAICVAVPIGLTISIYLSEYAPNKFRKTVKPLLELLAAVPTVIYGFFALKKVAPVLQNIIPDLPAQNALSAGIVMGIMIIPYVSSISEDALHSVPDALRRASYGMGATKFQTAFGVIVPSASSGIIVSIILAISRAVGETMIVAIASGSLAKLTLNPTESVQTITGYIVEVCKGDVQHGSVEYNTIYAAGITLFIFTFLLNTLSYRIRKKFNSKYE